MINEQLNFVEAHSIQDAWREVMWLCVKNGYDFVVKGGSYVGQIRKQLRDVHIRILEPGKRPLAPIMPPGIVGPTSDEKIDAYFQRYLFSGEKAENEQYTYGEYIVAQWERVVELLNQSQGNTNQACIAIGDVHTTSLGDPPCLRLISLKCVGGQLVMTVFFRSWDLFAGFPENLGGLQVLKELLLTCLTFPCTDGPIIAYSDGLHIYEQYFGIVDSLNIDKVKVGEQALSEKQKYALEHGV